MSGYDLVVRGGTVVDPAGGVHEPRDVAVAGGRIAAVAEPETALTAAEVVDAAGLVVAPGLVDLHVHAFASGTLFGINPDATCLARGVTTVLDAGSAGAVTWPAFEAGLAGAVTRVLSLLNISMIGMPADGELLDADWADPARAVAVVAAHRDRIVGVKVRLSPRVVGPHARSALRAAVEAAAAAGVRLMVHPNGSELPLREILAPMRAGDIVTHCFNSTAQAAVGDDGRVRDEVVEARRRGVLFDVGHGSGSFSFDAAEAALGRGFPPDTISSDLHTLSLPEAAVSLPHVMSKFLALGMSLDDVLARTTMRPGRILDASGLLGTLAPGAAADIALLRLQRGRFDYRDVRGAVRTGDTKIVPVTTIRGGKVVA